MTTNKTTRNSHMNSEKVSDEKKVLRIKKPISKDINNQENTSRIHISSNPSDKVNTMASSLKNNVSVKKIIKDDKKIHKSLKNNSITDHIDKTKPSVSHKDPIKINNKTAKDHKKSSSDIKVVNNMSSSSSKVLQINKGSDSERTFVPLKPMKTKPATKTTENKIFKATKLSTKTAAVPPKQTADHFKISKTTEKPKKVVPTNVTINSPVHKKLENDNFINSEISSSMSNTFFGDNLHDQEQENNCHGIMQENNSKKHQRFRTRTLESHEVILVGNPEISDINIKGMKSLISGVKNVEKSIFHEPEAFYVSLEENKVAQENTIPKARSPEISPVPKDNDSDSYDDDFESYESDFESYSSTVSIKINSNVDTNSDNSEIESDNSKENMQLKIFEIKDDEKHLDSGNYDLRDVNSKLNSMREDVIESPNILMQDNLKSADSGKHISYTDEGFDENSGGFSSTSIISKQEEQSVHGNMFGIGLQFLDKSSKRQQEQNNDRKKLRVKELLSLITLDIVKYSLFDMAPIPYDIFIKTFGKSNSNQGSSQTNDDSVDKAVQTDFTNLNNKWTQFPVDFSENDITTISKSAKNGRINDSVLNIYSLDNSCKNSVESYEKIKFIKLSCPLQIYCKQRLGCSINASYSKEEIDKKIILSYKNLFSKTVQFMQKVGNTMISYLNEKGYPLNSSATQTSKFPFSKRYSTLLPHTFDNELLKDRPPAMLSFSENSINCFLTVHLEKKITKELLDAPDMQSLFYMRTLICIWTSQNSIATTPVKILISAENIRSCVINGGLTGIVISGSDTGVLYAWDLNESENGELLISKAIQDYDLPKSDENSLLLDDNNKDSVLHKKKAKVIEILLRSCSFSNSHLNSISGSTIWNGPIVDIVFLRSMMRNNNTFEQNQNNQVSTLHQYGILTLWTVINSVPLKTEDFVSADRYCSNLVLYKSHVIDIRKSLSINYLENLSNHLSGLTNKSSKYPEFDLITARRRNSLKKGDISIPNRTNVDLIKQLSEKLMGNNDNNIKGSLFRQEINISEDRLTINTKPESDMYDAISSREKRGYEKLGNNLWGGTIVCTQVKHFIDKNASGHFLIACNGGKIVHHLQSSLQNKSLIFSCGDHAVSTSCIEMCPYQIPYFLVGCHDSTIHLYSLDSSKPIKNFICLNNIAQFTYLSNTKYSIENASRLSTLKRVDDKKYLGHDIISVQWSKSKPCRFYGISRSGEFLEWDLANSDISHKLYGRVDPASPSFIQNLKIVPIIAGESKEKKEHVILQFESGEIQVHSMEDDYNSSLETYQLEKKLLYKYLDLF